MVLAAERTATKQCLPPSDIHIAREKKKVLTHRWQLHPSHLLSFQVLEVVVVAASTWNQYLHSRHRNHPHLHLTSQETRLHVKQKIKGNQAPCPFILSHTCPSPMRRLCLLISKETILHFVTRCKSLTSSASCTNSFPRLKFKEEWEGEEKAY